MPDSLFFYLIPSAWVFKPMGRWWEEPQNLAGMEAADFRWSSKGNIQSGTFWIPHVFLAPLSRGEALPAASGVTRCPGCLADGDTPVSWGCFFLRANDSLSSYICLLLFRSWALPLSLGLIWQPCRCQGLRTLLSLVSVPFVLHMEEITRTILSYTSGV